MNHEAHLLSPWISSAVQVLPMCAPPTKDTLLVCYAVASTFPLTTTCSHLLANAPALSRTHRCPGDGKQRSFSLVDRCRASANPRAVLPAAFFRPSSRCDPCSFRPPLLYCFCAEDPASVACSCRERQCPSKRQASNVGTWLKNVSTL